MYNNYGRIHRVAFRATISSFFAAAILAAICRIAVRFRYQKRIFFDDYILLFGCSAMISAFTLITIFFEDVYFDMGLILGPVEQVIQEASSPGFEDRIFHYQQMAFSTEVMCWLTIFAVKMSYLMFFRQMLDRLQTQIMYWKVVTGIVVVAGLFCVCNIFISCPHFGVSSIQCAQGSGFTRTMAISQVANAFDMLTDLLIVSVPIKLLRKVNVRLQQKLVLYTFLCLSICMFAVTLIRTTKPTVYGNTGTTVDVQWLIFWQAVEACVAVIVVSLTSFRSLYGIKSLQQEQKNKKRFEPWLSSYRRNLLSRRKQREVDEFGNPVSSQNHALPSVPGGTLTGMRTMISGFGKPSRGPVKGSTLLSIDEGSRDDEQSDAIKVVVDLDTRESIKNYV